MTDSAEKMREAIKRFHRNCCYPEAFDFEVDGLMNELAALSASGTKSEIDEAGLERAVRECARITAPEITDSEYEAIRERRDPRYINTRGEMRRALTAYLGEANAVSIKPGPSDPIPSPSAPPLSAPVRRLKGGCDG